MKQRPHSSHLWGRGSLEITANSKKLSVLDETKANQQAISLLHSFSKSTRHYRKISTILCLLGSRCICSTKTKTLDIGLSALSASDVRLDMVIHVLDFTKQLNSRTLQPMQFHLGTSIHPSRLSIIIRVKYKYSEKNWMRLKTKVKIKRQINISKHTIL